MIHALYRLHVFRRYVAWHHAHPVVCRAIWWGVVPALVPILVGLFMEVATGYQMGALRLWRWVWGI